MSKNFQLAASAVLLAFLMSCQEDDQNPTITPVSVGFQEDVQVPESATTQTIRLHLSQPAPAHGLLRIAVSSAAPDSFTLQPAAEEDTITINVKKDATEVSFSLTPVNNDLLDGNKTAQFHLAEVPEGWTADLDKKQLQLTITDDESTVTASFSSGELSLRESESVTITILLSEAVGANSTIRVGLADWNASQVTTSPAFDAETGILELAVNTGARTASFEMTAINDELLKGHRQIRFTIVGGTGLILPGSEKNLAASVTDDELEGKAKSWETHTGIWRVKETYEYDEQGRLSKLHWENATPGLTSGTKTYFYGENGLLERIQHFDNYDEYFYAEGGRIVRSEVIQHGVKKSYTLYDYDAAGNVGGKAFYWMQNDGEFALSMIYIYLYFNTGNLYKQLTYSPILTDGEYTLISTRTYDHYSQQTNPFALELLPTIKAQQHLPGLYSQEENGHSLSYALNYEFDAQGRMVGRSTTGEATTYTYY